MSFKVSCESEENVLAKLLFDPLVIPVESIAGDGSVASDRLTVEGLRFQFMAQPVWTPEKADEELLRKLNAPPLPASVLIPIVVREEGLTLLLTQRTDHLTNHAGQVSFPGGRFEVEDVSSIETALRETREEIGLDRRHIEVIGILPDYFTGTGYQVTPVVAIIHPPFDLKADASEVAEIFEVPFSFLMDGMNHQRRSAEFPNGFGRRTFYSMPYDRFFIWGATAGMLRNLFHFLKA